MPVTAAQLDTARQTGDADADAVIAQLYPATKGAEVLHHLLRVHGRPETTTESVEQLERDWFRTPVPFPAWGDPARCNRGGEFFAEWGLEIGLGLFLAALPQAYAAEPGVPVLAMTARLETDAKTRIFETAQLVLDMGVPDTLQPGQPGYVTIRHVRLMHAGVRHLITTDPRIEPPGTPPEAVFRWEPHWGVPLNQEHLAGTMVSFSYAMLEVLDAMGLDYDQAGADDFLHLWAVAGHLLGVEDHLIPHTRADWKALDELIKQRNHRRSQFGIDLTAALLEVVDGFVPRLLRPVVGGLPPTMMRSMIGDDICDMLDVPAADWTRFPLEVLRLPVGSFASRTGHSRLGRAMARRLALTVMRGFVDAERRGHRPDFAIPERLPLVDDHPLKKLARRT